MDIPIEPEDREVAVRRLLAVLRDAAVEALAQNEALLRTVRAQQDVIDHYASEDDEDENEDPDSDPRLSDTPEQRDHSDPLD